MKRYRYVGETFSFTGGTMKKIVVPLLLFLSAWFLCIFSFAKAGEVKSDEHPELRLTQKLHRLLSAEMNAIQNGMTNMAIAVPAGRWNEVAETARKIKKGYIMNKELSEDQMTEFTNSLPPGYIEMEREFMNTAGMLMNAAQDQDKERILSSLHQLNRSCVHCHEKFARKRFPGFKE